MISIRVFTFVATLIRAVSTQLMIPRVASPQILAHRGATGIALYEISMR